MQRVENSSEKQFRHGILGLAAEQILADSRIAKRGRIYIRPRNRRCAHGAVRFGELRITGERFLGLIENAVDNLLAEFIVVRNHEPIFDDRESRFVHGIDFDTAIILDFNRIGLAFSFGILACQIRQRCKQVGMDSFICRSSQNYRAGRRCVRRNIKATTRRLLNDSCATASPSAIQ